MAQIGVPVIGSEVRRRREALLLTQEQLAEKVGIHQNTLVSIEAKPSYKASFNTIKALAKSLGCEPRDILPESEEVVA